jgi:hypothetical protein
VAHEYPIYSSTDKNTAIPTDTAVKATASESLVSTATPAGAWAIFDTDNEGNTVKTVLNMNPNGGNGFVRDDNGITVNINDVCLETASDSLRMRVEQMREMVDMQIAINQWERENNFSFLSADTSTPEGKGIFNDMLRKALGDGLRTHQPFLSSLNRVEGTDWQIADGAEALIGHEILGMIEVIDTKSNVLAGQVNEFGFTINMPGWHQGTNFMLLDLTGQPNVRGGFGLMDGGQTYAPEIRFIDAFGLGGMSFDDRRLFLDMTQQIIDDIMPGIDVRQLTFSTGFLNDADFKNNHRSLMLANSDGISFLSSEQRDILEEALNQNRLLVDMKLRAETSGNRGFGEFTMSVLDAEGNALAKDQIRLIAGDRSVTTTVDTIKDMNQQQIFEFINRQR